MKNNWTLKNIARPTLSGLLEALSETLIKSQHAEKVLQKTLKTHKKWGSRDRRFVAEQFYDIVRNFRLLISAIDHPWGEAPLIKVDLEILKKIISLWLYKQGFEIQWENDQTLNLDFKKALTHLNNKNLDFDIKYSLPHWLHEKGEEQFKKKWVNVAAALNERAPLFIRVNLLKTNTQELKAQLKEEGFEFFEKENCPQLLYSLERKNVFQTTPYKKGLFEIQDMGSQEIAPFCDVKPKMRVVDGCAGAGGKSLHLATLMKNKGKIIALDIHEWKLKELKKRAARNGIDCIETRVSQSKNLKRLKGSADRVLIDVPCSGLGVLKRKPDTKWKMSPQRIKELIQIQREILMSHKDIVHEDGELIYATCSLLKEENENQVSWFLENNPEWELIKEKSILPEKEGSDGFYMAKLKRK